MLEREGDMSVSTGSSSSAECISSTFGLLTRAISEWRSSLTLSHELDDLDDWMRRDIGLPSAVVRPEGSKPFWVN
jgi:uncharacterized protein YjiS (DUF1127 family)